VDFELCFLNFDLLDVGPLDFDLFLEADEVAEKTKVVFSEIHATRIERSLLTSEVIEDLLC
jgi:hypothetical protein